jgi:hypothetical protein
MTKLGGKDFAINRPISDALEQLRRGGLGDTLDEGLKNGLQLEIPHDVDAAALMKVGTLIDNGVGKIFGNTPRIGEKILGSMEKVQTQLFDKVTWDFMHTGLKALTFTKEFEKAVAKEKGELTDARRSQIASEVAAFTNDTFGGIDWFRVAQEAESNLGRNFAMSAFSPNGRMAMQAAMFAPDWTMSTFRAMAKAIPGKTDTPLNKSLHQAYTLRTALMYFTLMDGVNYQLSGHHIWENKDKMMLEFKDGTKMQAFKHAAEGPEWIIDPLKTVTNKLAYPLKEPFSQLAKQEWLGGPKMKGGRLEHAAAGLAPFPAKPFLDPDLSAGEAAKKSISGSLGMQTYGSSDDTKERRKERLAREKELKKRKEENTP